MSDAPSGGATVKIGLPAGAAVTSVSDEIAILNSAVTDNTLTLTTTKQKGVFYLYGVTLSAPGAAGISASITSGGITAPLGSVTLDAQTLVLMPTEDLLP